jgi:flagellin-like hook-associated protein FlgL
LVQEISISVDAGGATWSGTVVNSNQATIGNANTGSVDVRFTTDVLGTVGNTDTLVIAKSGGLNELQLHGVVTQVSTPEDNYTFRITALSNRTYSVENLTTGSVATNTGSIAATGTATGLGLDSLRGIELTFSGVFATGETAVFHSSTNNVLVVQNNTTLASISRFRDFGVFDGRNSLELQLNYGANGASTTIIVNSTDTVETLEAKLSLAIANPNSNTDLNLEGAIVGGNNPDLVHYNLTGPAQGTLSIMTPDPSGQLVFAGDEKLLNALGLVDIESWSSPVYSVTAVNIHTGESIGSIRTNTNKIQGLIPGVDVVFDTTVGFKLDADPGVGTYGNSFSNDRSDLEGTTWASDDPNKTGILPFIKAYERPVVSIVTTAEEEFLHIAPSKMTLQIGANQGQTLGFNIEQMDAIALNIDNVLVVNPELAQAAITKVDDAINAVASQRAKLGAIQNRLESTIRNLNVTMENLTAAESRIRDLDIAQQTIDFTRDQILLQAGTAVLAQANQLPNVVLSLLR